MSRAVEHFCRIQLIGPDEVGRAIHMIDGEHIYDHLKDKAECLLRRLENEYPEAVFAIHKDPKPENDNDFCAFAILTPGETDDIRQKYKFGISEVV